MTDLARETLAPNDNRIGFGNWGISTASQLCEQSFKCQMTWIPTVEIMSKDNQIDGVSESLRFECGRAACSNLAWALNASPESVAISLAEKQADQ